MNCMEFDLVYAGNGLSDFNLVQKDTGINSDANSAWKALVSYGHITRKNN